MYIINVQLQYIHSHQASINIYMHSTPSRKLLTGAPNSSSDKKKSLFYERRTQERGSLERAKASEGGHSRLSDLHQEARFCQVEEQAKWTRRPQCSNDETIYIERKMLHYHSSKSRYACACMYLSMNINLVSMNVNESM